MVILVLNCGSSSLKYQVLDMKSEQEYNLLAKGLVERIGLEMGDITHTVTGRDKYKLHKPIATHTEGIKSVLELLVSPEHGVLKSLSDIDAVGHRVAHGGEYFSESKKVDAEVIEKIEKCCELAPLHNPANLLGIKAISELMPQTPQVAVFDTSFHQTIPDYAYMYAIPYEYYSKYKIRRYGFHGTSHQFVARKAAKLAGLDFDKSKIVTCHLGNGSSVTAICNGKSVDTSMGFTPVEGVVMGTRCGQLDPGVILYLLQYENMNAHDLETLLYQESGLLGVSGISNDVRDLMASDDPAAKTALELFVYRVVRETGSLAAACGGLDAFVFTAGIGERSPEIRAAICEQLDWLGLELDERANRLGELKISTDTSPVSIWILPTFEELMIARHGARLSTRYEREQQKKT